MKITIKLNHVLGQGKPTEQAALIPAGYYLESFYIGEGGYVSLELTNEKIGSIKKKNNTCSHGDDWDRCPVCCH